MKKNTGNKIRLGIFVFIGIILFSTGIYFIGDQKQLFSTTFSIKGIFKNVNGLKIGNNVQFSGINVGTVSTIEIISDTSVSVNMTIEEGTRKFIRKNASAIIGAEGLMGNKIISIIPGTNDEKTIENNDLIKTCIPVNIDDILIKVKVTADNAAIISEQLAEILLKVNNGNGTISRLLQDSTIAENINKTLINLRKSTKGLDENMEAAKHNILLKGYFKDKEREAEKAKKEKK
ncbi:MAG: organic solvent ABC transporter substrate-binding protein [Bacteroidetes bacterium RIFCSPLOWO2_12_FULL_35_15]|nr:MAG: organic solvent ABC transporter substrate-binding protein [Bacteroidetes bacterium RIFCSPLOWO2_12_FULL_35_15]